MGDKVQSIEDLIGSGIGAKDDESTQGKFQAKQLQIKKRELERLTKQMADDIGMSYISLSGFPVSPEAISLLKKEEALELNAVCFYYDGTKIYMGVMDPENCSLNTSSCSLVNSTPLLILRTSGNESYSLIA